MNHEGFAERLSFVDTLLRQRYKLEPRKIEPLEYDEDCPFPYNNFVYCVKLSPEPRTAITSSHQPGTIALPLGVSSVVVRLSNAAAGLNDLNRVQNEVAVMSLMRDALSTLPTQIVPAVYGWASAANQQGWILQQYMAGKPLDAEFENMDFPKKRNVLRQMAEILVRIQQYGLPGTIKEYGGLNFDESGNVISGPLTVLHGGPFQTYEALYRESLRLQLATADKNSVVRGWQSKGVRQRLENFAAHGIKPIMQDVDSRKVLVHGDFTCNNLLFDKETQRITAILDFDWAQVSGVAEEFFRSLSDVHGRLPGPYSVEAEQLALRQALLEGFPTPLPAQASDVNWRAAEAWDNELEHSGAQRPRTIKGIAALSKLYWLSGQICPFLLFNETIANDRSKEQHDKDKEDAEALLIQFLEDHGY
ncbi:MAG: hypothetical protein M4579_001316 [Chaenotheca gracillima]|nr:MAG: hypothetical protein M4579_001316 [Chaenotheca gracillima]